MKDIIVILTDDQNLLTMDDIEGVKILALLPDENINSPEILVEKLGKMHEVFLADGETLHGIIYKFKDDEVNSIMGSALEKAYNEFMVFDYDGVIKALGDMWYKLKDLASKIKQSLIVLDNKRLMDIASHNIGYNCEVGMSYGTALDRLTDNHEDIAPINQGWGEYDFVTVTPHREVESHQLWSESNQKAATRNGGSITTGPYLMSTVNGHTNPHITTNEHIFGKWMVASDYIVPKTLKLEDNVLKMDFRISNGNDVLLTDPPLWMLFDTNSLVGGRNVIFIGPNNLELSISRESAALVGVVTGAMEALQSRSLLSASFVVPKEDNLIISNPLTNYYGALSAIGLGSATSNDSILELLTAAIDSAKEYDMRPTFIVNVTELVGLCTKEGGELVDTVVNALVTLSDADPEVRWATIDINNLVEL